MRWVAKIILFAISLLLSMVTSFLIFLIGIGTGTEILYLLMIFCIFGYLVSSYGIPMIGVIIISLLQEINERINSV